MSDQPAGFVSESGRDRELQLARTVEALLAEVGAGSDERVRLARIVAILIETVGADMGVLALVKPEDGRLEPTVTIPPAGENATEDGYPGLEQLIQQVGRERQAHLVRDFPAWTAGASVSTHAGASVSTHAGASVSIHPDLQCALAVPLSLNGQPEGVLALASEQSPAAFGEDDLAIAGLFAHLVELELQIERWQAKIEHLTITDSLTGVWTRSQFFERAEQAFRQAVRYQRPLSAILIDIDRFKMLNEVHGYAVGDQVLGTVAHNVVSRLRDTDLLGRYSGDEFMLLLPETDLERARLAAERMRTQIASAPTDTPKGTFFVTISAGVASLQSGPIEQLGQLLDLAGQALHAAKLAGRNQVAVYSAQEED